MAVDSYLTQEIKSVIKQLGLIQSGKLFNETKVDFDENILQMKIISTDYFTFLDEKYDIKKIFLQKKEVKDYISELIKQYIILKLKQN